MIKRIYLFFGYCWIALFIQGCTVTFVQPYDEKLVDATESFYKLAANKIEEARAKAPDSRELKEGEAAESNSGHISHFVSTYSTLKIEANSLVIRALVSSGQVDEMALPVHQKIEDIISRSVPSNCAGASASIGGPITLTVQNYLDLKCLVVHWSVQHEQAPNKILKKSNWESRQIALMNMIISLQKAESFKKVANVD
jgi:hypothetical protein